MRKLNIDEEFLKDRYYVKEMTLQQIANELGVSRQTISNKMQDYGLTIRNNEYNKEHNKSKRPLKKKPRYRIKSDFERVYKKLKSLDLVAEHYGINLTTASDWKQKHNIPTIREYSYKGRKQLVVDKPYANEEWLRKMYSEYSLEDLGKMLNCSPSTIGKWCKKFGIKTRSISEQWDLKTKKGNKLIKEGCFDLQLYKKVYGIGRNNVSLPKKLKQMIIELMGECESCGYKDVLDLHHIDFNHGNNDPKNHSVLCPNCHAKIHRLGIPFEDLVPNHKIWSDYINNYQEAK